MMDGSKLYFTRAVAEANEEIRKKMVGPNRLFVRLAKLTGCTVGRDIFSRILEWKRVYDNVAHVTSVYDLYGKKIVNQLDKVSKVRGRQCLVCGRVYRSKKGGMSRYFGGRKSHVCKKCRLTWKNEYGQHGKGAEDERRENSKAV